MTQYEGELAAARIEAAMFRGLARLGLVIAVSRAEGAVARTLLEFVTAGLEIVDEADKACVGLCLGHDVRQIGRQAVGQLAQEVRETVQH